MMKLEGRMDAAIKFAEMIIGEKIVLKKTPGRRVELRFEKSAIMIRPVSRVEDEAEIFYHCALPEEEMPGKKEDNGLLAEVNRKIDFNWRDLNKQISHLQVRVCKLEEVGHGCRIQNHDDQINVLGQRVAKLEQLTDDLNRTTPNIDKVLEQDEQIRVLRLDVDRHAKLWEQMDTALGDTVLKVEALEQKLIELEDWCKANAVTDPTGALPKMAKRLHRIESWWRDPATTVTTRRPEEAILGQRILDPSELGPVEVPPILKKALPEDDDFPQRFKCDTCGIGVNVNEDGCCATCGRDATVVVVKNSIRERGMPPGAGCAHGYLNRFNCPTCSGFRKVEATERPQTERDMGKVHNQMAEELAQEKPRCSQCGGYIDIGTACGPTHAILQSEMKEAQPKHSDAMDILSCTKGLNKEATSAFHKITDEIDHILQDRDLPLEDLVAALQHITNMMDSGNRG